MKTSGQSWRLNRSVRSVRKQYKRCIQIWFHFIYRELSTYKNLRWEKKKTKAESYVKILNIKVAVFTKTEHVHSINTKRRWPEKKDWVGRSQSGLPMSWCDFDASILWGFFGRGAVIGLLIIVWLSHLYIQNEDASVYPLLNEIMKSLYFLHLLHIVAAKVAEQNSAKLARDYCHKYSRKKGLTLIKDFFIFAPSFP